MGNKIGKKRKGQKLKKKEIEKICFATNKEPSVIKKKIKKLKNINGSCDLLIRLHDPLCRTEIKKPVEIKQEYREFMDTYPSGINTALIINFIIY